MQKEVSIYTEVLGLEFGGNKMIEGIGYLLFSVGLAFMTPKFIKQYKEDRNVENTLEVIGVLLLIASSIFLGVLKFL